MVPRSDRDKTILGYSCITSALAVMAMLALTRKSEVLLIFPLVGGCMIGVAQLADRNKSGFISSNPWLLAVIHVTIIFPGVYHFITAADASPFHYTLGVLAVVLPFVLIPFRSRFTGWFR